MAASNELKALVAQMPDPDDRQMYTKNIDKKQIESAVAGMAKGGREHVAGLIDLLGDPGSESNVKPHYALHSLGNYFLIMKDEPGRKMFAETLAAALSSERPTHIKAFLCQELQWAGRKEVAPALSELLLDEALVEPAAMALVAIRQGAAMQFRKALPRAKGKCRLNILQGLGAVDDRKSAATLRRALQDEDQEIRLVAGWGLARLADISTMDALLQAVDQTQGWERIQGNKHCLVMAENLAASGHAKEAAKIYRHLSRTRTDPSEAHVREAAERGLRL